MSLALLVSGLVLVLQDLDLRALGVLDDLGVDAHRSELVSGGGYIGAIDEQNRGESHGCTRLTLDLLDLNEVTFGNLVLLSAGLDDRESLIGLTFYNCVLDMRSQNDLTSFTHSP